VDAANAPELVFDTDAKELEDDPLGASRGATEANAEPDAELDELLPIFHEAVADDEEPTRAGVLLLYDEEDDIYLIMARIPCTQYTRRPKEMGG